MIKRDWVERYWEKVNKNGPVPLHRPELGPCWEWKAFKNKGGYGKFNIESGIGVQLAHRVAFLIAFGRWPKAGNDCCHACDNRSCQNPVHLFEGTRLENVCDCIAKGRNERGESHHAARLTWGQVFEIRKERAESGTSQQKIADKYGVSRGAIQRIVEKSSWVHAPII